ncbi:MAG: DMT family transporter [Vulcanimicrobiaceae bacterium]
MRSVDARAGVLLGLVGIIAFSLTLPATRVAVPQLGATFVGLGRAIVAAVLAGALLALRREPFPKRHALAIVTTGLGVVVGFPLFSALALRTVPAVHGAVIVGFLPAATAVFAVLRGGERPSAGFWLGSMLGLAAIVAFAEVQGAGSFRAADLFLVLAVAFAAYGYAEGGRISRELGGWRVICWALVLVAPLLLIPVAYDINKTGAPHADAAGWIGFAYVAIVSMFLGFFAWYAGLARGGIARVGQLQLLQVPLTLIWGVLLLRERVTLITVVATCLVIASAALSQRFRVATPNQAMPATASTPQSR